MRPQPGPDCEKATFCSQLTKLYSRVLTHFSVVSRSQPREGSQRSLYCAAETWSVFKWCPESSRDNWPHRAGVLTNATGQCTLLPAVTDRNRHRINNYCPQMLIPTAQNGPN